MASGELGKQCPAARTFKADMGIWLSKFPRQKFLSCEIIASLILVSNELELAKFSCVIKGKWCHSVHATFDQLLWLKPRLTIDTFLED